jgi:cytochrome c5
MRRAAIIANIALAAAAAALAGCGGSLPTVSDGDAARVQERWPGVTAAELNQGRALYADRCGVCHLPVPPTQFTPEEWPARVDAMTERAGITPAEAEAVQRYVITMAK